MSYPCIFITLLLRKKQTHLCNKTQTKLCCLRVIAFSIFYYFSIQNSHFFLQVYLTNFNMLNLEKTISLTVKNINNKKWIEIYSTLVNFKSTFSKVN